MEKFLSDHNFSVSNLDYPSRHFTIPKLAQKVRQQIITISEEKRLSTYHFVTHSMGGIILRQIQATNPQINVLDLLDEQLHLIGLQTIQASVIHLMSIPKQVHWHDYDHDE